jgi:negative regulator of flagellin synthesis FlgM
MDIRNLFGGVNTTTNRNNQTDKSNTATQQTRSSVAEETTKNTSATQERVTLTATATRFTQVQMNMNTQPEVNRDRIAELRKAIADGSYKVDASRLAGRMINFESALSAK